MNKLEKDRLFKKSIIGGEKNYMKGATCGNMFGKSIPSITVEEQHKTNIIRNVMMDKMHEEIIQEKSNKAFNKILFLLKKEYFSLKILPNFIFSKLFVLEEGFENGYNICTFTFKITGRKSHIINDSTFIFNTKGGT